VWDLRNRNNYHDSYLSLIKIWKCCKFIVFWLAKFNLMIKRKIFEKYVGMVEDALEISKEEIFTKTRKRENVEARDLLFYLCARRNMRGNFILARCKENGLDLDDSQVSRGKNKIEELRISDPDWKELVNKLVND